MKQSALAVKARPLRVVRAVRAGLHKAECAARHIDWYVETGQGLRCSGRVEKTAKAVVLDPALHGKSSLIGRIGAAVEIEIGPLCHLAEEPRRSRVVFYIYPAQLGRWHPTNVVGMVVMESAHERDGFAEPHCLICCRQRVGSQAVDDDLCVDSSGANAAFLDVWAAYESCMWSSSGPCPQAVRKAKALPSRGNGHWTAASGARRLSTTSLYPLVSSGALDGTVA